MVSKDVAILQDFSDRDVARLYDVLNPWGKGDAFFLNLVMQWDRCSMWGVEQVRS